MKQGYKLYKKAKKVILGGNMLLSKRPEMTLPGVDWPNYFSQAKKILYGTWTGKNIST